MRPGTKPHIVSSLLPYHHGTITNIEAGSVIQGAPVCAGCTKDGTIAWVTRGPVLELVDTQTRNCLASWTFGAILKDTHTCISSVTEYQCGHILRLLVGVNSSSSPGGMLCMLDVSLSKVIKAIEVPHKVTYVEPVTSFGGEYVPMWALNEQLRQFYGIAAVGTEGGIIYLIDMCLDDEVDYSDEITPNKLLFITPRSRDVPQCRIQALSRGQQLCMVLNEEALGNHFQYRRCDGAVTKTFKSDYVKVTCLKYIPQIGNLVVGFNFGCYQLWKLHIPVLEYSSRLDADAFPVTRIAYQEPENDPKNFCYIWIARDPSEEEEEEGLSSMALYQLAYNKKTWYSNYGAFYEELTSVSLRFDLDLTAMPLNSSVKTTVSSKIIAFYTLEDPNYSPPTRLAEDESFEESVHGPDLSLCVVVWESSDGQSTKDSCHLGVFDMNRWYHAQMPSTIRSLNGTMETCPYMANMSLDDAADIATPDNILAVHVGTDKLRKFTNTSPMPPEQHFYPSSLSFEALLVTEGGLVKAHYLGTQRQVLASMQKMGPSILLNPKELYNLCIYMGLLPRPLDVSSHNPSQVEMRESLLSLALDYSMLGFIIKCVQEWADGEYVHVGCTLKFILEWTWDKVAQIKNTIDMTSMQLYDWSGITLDQRSMQTLYQSHQKLDYLASVFKVLLNHSAPTTEQGFVDLQNKLCALTYLIQHLQVVLWFIKVGLLPERDDADELPDHQHSYPVASVVHAYKLRRQELEKLHLDAGESTLMIDGIVQEMGPAVKSMWLREGGDGLYPPPCLHALLGIYLLSDVDLMSKHSVVLYLLLDLVSMMNRSKHQQFADKISKFNKTFSIPLSQVKQVQGCWLLDHGDYEESMSVMLDPMVLLEMGRWQHCRIIKSLLYQGDSKMALRYINTAQPSLTKPEEVKLKLTVLLANGLIAEALEYQRTYRDQANMQDLLFHLFLVCQQMKMVDQLLQLPLMESEECHLVDYLMQSSEPQSMELLVLHYLQRARYVEAIRLNEKLKQGVLTETSTKARERIVSRNAILDGFSSTLSGVQRKFIFEKKNSSKQITGHVREVKRPKPLSTIVTKTNKNRVVSQATLLMEVMDKVQDIKLQTDHKLYDGVEAGPFICTPITPKVHSRLSQSQPVTYPAVQDETINTSLKTSLFSSLTPFSSSKLASPLVSKRKFRIFGAEAMKLLQTPEIRRKTPVKKVQMTSLPTTPQSILKVRKIVVSSQSPGTSTEKIVDDEMEVKQTKSVSKRLGYSDISAPSTPRSVSFMGTPTMDTPKQLRFSDVKQPLHVIPPPSSLRTPKGQRSPKSPPSPRSVKDRSPTPESIARSPKQFSKMDTLRRKPLHGQDLLSMETDDNHLAESEVEPMNQDEVVDEDITFHFGKENDGENDNSSADLGNAMEDLDIVHKTPPPTEQPSVLKHQLSRTSELPQKEISGMSYTQLRELRRDSPLKLRQSPLLKASPRSPTVKLSKSPSRAKYTPKYQQDEEDNKPTKNEEVSSISQHEETLPIEIDLTMEEDACSVEEAVITSSVTEESLTEARVQKAAAIIAGSVSPCGSLGDQGVSHEDSEISSSSRPETVDSSIEADTGLMDGITSSEVAETCHVSVSQEIMKSEGNINQGIASDEVSSSAALVSPTTVKTAEARKVAPERIAGRKSESKSPSPKRSPKRTASAKHLSESLELKITIPESSTKAPVSPRRSPRFLETRATLSPKKSPLAESQPVIVDVSSNSKQQKIDLSPRMLPTPPESEQDSPEKSSQEKVIKRKPNTPTRNTNTSSLLTPTRKSSRLLGQSLLESRSPRKSVTPRKRLSKAKDVPVIDSTTSERETNFSEKQDLHSSFNPVLTPTRRSSRIHDRTGVQSLSEENEITEKLTDQEEEPSATRRGPKKMDQDGNQSPEGLHTPTRQSGRILEKSIVEMPELESVIKLEDSTTPRRRGRKKNNDATGMPELKPVINPNITGKEISTPTKLSHKKNNKSHLDTSEVIIEEPTTPTRRSRKTVDHTHLNISNVKNEEPTTPTRRSRKTVDQTHMDISNVMNEKPTTPTRRSRKSVDQTHLDISNVMHEEPTTPTRRSRKTVDQTHLVISNVIHEEPTTPKRRSRKTVDQTHLDISNVMNEKPTTPTRRSRKTVDQTHLDISNVMNEEPTTPTTPTRRSRKTVDQTHLNRSEETTTPSRGSRKKKDKTHLDVTSTRQSHSPKKNDKSNLDILDVMQSEATTPTRRSRRKMDSSDLPLDQSLSADKQEISKEEPKTLTRQQQKTMEKSKILMTEKSEKAMSNYAEQVLEEGASLVDKKEVIEGKSLLDESSVPGDLPSSPFTFSDPKEIEYIKQGEQKPPTPLKSFIFSPPITRSGSVPRDTPKKRRAPREVELKEEAVESAVVPLQLDASSSSGSMAAVDDKIKIKKHRKKKMEEEETVLLISPIMLETIPQRVTRQQAKQQQQSNTAEPKQRRSKKKPARLW